MHVSIPTKEEFEVLHVLIKNYQDHSSPKVLADLWKQVSLYVRSFPRYAFRQNNEDIVANFYLYVLERKTTLFEKFDPALASFKSYLSLRLKSHYLNFIKREQNLKKIDISYTDEEFHFQESKAEFEEHISAGNNTDVLSSANEPTYQNWFPDYQADPLKYLCVKLYYLDFFNEEDFVRLPEYTDKSYAILLEEFDELCNIVFHKKNEQLKLDERLSGLLHNILTLSKKISVSTGPSKNNQPSDDQQEMLKQLEKKRDQLIGDYHRISVFSPIRNIAKILGEGEIKVANILSYQRKVMEKRIAKLIEPSKHLGGVHE